jgi:Zn-finger nucleic acid-binding protein
MVEIECPLCAESIDLGMAEEGGYECPYCENEFYWEPDEFRAIGILQCPKGCGQLSYASFGGIGDYKCQKCKGSLLNAKNIGTILEDESGSMWNVNDKVGTLESLLEQGVPCDLDCPTCKGKMVEIKVYYEPPNPEGFFRPNDLFSFAIGMVLAAGVIAYEASKHNFEGGSATLILDGCGDCGSFWFDKGEIDRIRKGWVKEKGK